MSGELGGFEPLVGADVVAGILGTSERHVVRLTGERRIPFVRVGGKNRYEVTAVVAWIAANRVDPS